MYLTHLSLTNFRNFTRLDVEIPRGSVLLVGDNAQGKTSLLEAIYFLSSLISFQASSDRQLINFLVAREPLSAARIVAHFSSRGRQHKLEVRVIFELNGVNNGRTRKEVLFDEGKMGLGEAVGKFNAVLFLPQMLRVIERSPEERRRYLNLTLSQVFPGYAQALSEYNKLLSQRNALLKHLSEGKGKSDQLDFWDEKLAESGALLMYSRIQALEELERFASCVHQEITRRMEVLRIDYCPAYDPSSRPERQYPLPLDASVSRSGIKLEQIEQGLHAALLHLRNEEITRGVTTIGPHRDDVRFLSNGIDLGIYGSRGQVRTAMLSLKLAEVAWMKDKTGHWPVLLLDEVLAELDNTRRADLLKRVTDSEQSLLTTTDLDLFTPNFVSQATLWRIHAGKLQLERSA
ncbi:MAG: DNA replication/repair protein RecF [Chloroflexota bacterium]